MAFYVGERYQKTYGVADMAGDDVDFTDFDGLSIYWVFEFYNRDTDKIQGTVANESVTFTIPDGFLSGQRAGPLRHHLLLVDSDSVPTARTRPVNDTLMRAGPTPEELGI